MVRLSAVDSSETVSSGRLSRGSFKAMIPRWSRRFIGRSLSIDIAQRRTFAFVERLIERRVIGLVDHRRLEDELAWHVLFAQAAHRHFDGETALREGIVVAAADDVAGFDEIHHLAAGIDADDQSFLFRRLQRIDRAHCHWVVGGENAVDMREFAQETGDDLFGLPALIISRLAVEELYVGKLLD